MLAQVYWLYTRGEFNKTYLLSGFLITEVDEPIHAIEKHRFYKVFSSVVPYSLSVISKLLCAINEEYSM